MKRWIYYRETETKSWKRIPREDFPSLIGMMEKGKIDAIDGETISLKEARIIIEAGFSLISAKEKKEPKEIWKVVPNAKKFIIAKTKNGLEKLIPHSRFNEVLKLIKNQEIIGIKIKSLSEKELKKIWEEGFVVLQVYNELDWTMIVPKDCIVKE